jgi:hypothetical protein
VRLAPTAGVSDPNETADEVRTLDSAIDASKALRASATRAIQRLEQAGEPDPEAGPDGIPQACPTELVVEGE